MSNLRTPNEMLDKACEMMLDGRRPADEDDWVLVVNFFAVNIHPDVVAYAMPLMKAIYAIPLSNEFMAHVVEFHAQRE